jgi:hypothetical protein
MQLTKLRAAPVRQAEVPPCAPAGETDGGTASQLIRSVLRTRGVRVGRRIRRAAPLGLAGILISCQPNLPSDLPGLMNAMGDYDMRVSIAAARRVEERYGKAGLLQALKHPNPYTRSKAAHFLMSFPGSDVETALSDAASDPDRHVRMWCAWSPGEQGTAAVLPILERLAEDPEEIVRLKAVEAREKVQLRSKTK